jgi:uncharacterized Zn finger protein
MRRRKQGSPRPTGAEEDIGARSRSGDMVENWWAERWIEALERITDAGRLRRGRTIAQRGQILSMEEEAGGVRARVQDERATPYQVSIQVAALSDAQWQAVLSALGQRALFSAELLAGEMPQQIEEAFQAAGVSLFPGTAAELETSCSCPDWANPCKHVAAAHYILGEQFDRDPFLLFRLRGRSQEQILAALAAQRQAGEDQNEDPELEPVVEEPAPSVADALDRFWQMGQSLDHFATAIEQAATPLPILRRLGPAPFTVADLERQLGPIYLAIAEKALQAAYAGAGSVETTDDEEEPT